MIKFLINRPIAVCMTFLALLFLGIVSYKRLPVSLLPDVAIPEVTVKISYPQFTAREFENNITKNFRRVLQQCSGLESIQAQTSNGQALIRMRFDYGTRIDYAAIEVNEKVDLMMQWLPRDLSRPQVIKASASDIPVFYLNMFLKKKSDDTDFLELSRFSKNVIAKRIEQLPEVGLVDITGQEKPEISIIPDEARMKSLGVTTKMIENFFSYNNIQIGNILVNDGHYRYNIRFSTQMKAIDDLKNLLLPIGNRIIELKEIATIQVRPQKRDGYFFSGGNKAISLAIIKRSDAKMQELKKKLKDETKRIEKDYPEIGFEIAQDQTKLLDHSINNLKSTLLIGSLLAFLVIFLFLSNIRLPILMGITIPISVVISILFFMVFGISINIISLSGLVLGIGMMIDNSIIVIDNISQYRERGLNLQNACIRATNEVIRPLLSSALTTTAVFIPLIFMSGIAGALFVDQAITVSIGLGVSFVVSITLLPVVYHILHTRNTNKNDKPKNSTFTKYKIFANFYEKGFQWIFKYRKIALSSFIAILALTVLLMFRIDKTTFPDFTQKDTMLSVDWNENISLDESYKRSQFIAHMIDSQSVSNNKWLGYQDYVLNNDYNLSSSQLKLYFDCHSAKDLDEAKKTITNYLRENYPSVSIKFEVPANIFEKTFVDQQLPFIVQIMSKEGQIDYKKASEIAYTISEKLELPTQNPIHNQYYTAILFDQEKLLLYDITVNEVFGALRTAFNENNIGNLKSYNEVIPVVIGAPEKSISEILREVKVRNSKGFELPIKEFLEIEKRSGFKTISAGVKGEYVPIGFDVKADKKAKYEKIVKRLFKNNDYAYTFSFTGGIYQFSQYFKELLIILIISLVLLYFILAAQFESLVQPLIILIEIPIDIAGALLLLILFGETLNIMSAIGIIVMSGIIINDSILKVDTINQLYRKEGLSLIEAIHEGGRRRLRPIIMTSLTTILALLPFIFGSGMGTELQKPLALAVIGGLGLGTFVSLFFIPLAYWFFYRVKSLNISETEN